MAPLLERIHGAGDGFRPAVTLGMYCTTDQLRPGYVRKPGDAAHEPLAIDVLRVRSRVVTQIVTFDCAGFKHFDLSATLGATVGLR